MTNVAIAHDQFRTMGGAERVAVAIAREFDCPIYVMRHDEGVGPDDVDFIDLSSRVGGWCMHSHYLFQDAYQMLAWGHVEELYEYDTVIQTKTNPYWFVPKDTQTIIRYCHSTPRGMYDLFHKRGGHSVTDGIKILQRVLYHQVLPYADAWIANSDLVKRRMDTYFGLDDPDVIYPPVDVEGFGRSVAPDRDYYAYVGRLEGHKRVDLICEVAKHSEKEFIIAGDGSEREHLESIAPSNVTFRGYVSESEKQELLSSATATLFLAENEDFGIVPIESMASGTPVIGVHEGFTKHQITDGENGLLCEANVEDVLKTIERYEADGVKWDAGEIETFANQFSESRFTTEMRELVALAEEESKVKPKLKTQSNSVAE